MTGRIFHIKTQIKFKWHRYKLVYHIDSSQSGDAVISKLKNLTELKGKKIGAEGINTFSHLFALKALEKAGLDEGNVEFVLVAGINTSAALERGGN